MRSCEPDPLAAGIVHVREDGRNGTDLSGRLGWRCGFPGSGVKMLDKNLVYALIGGKDLNCGTA
jgi:hypothetical protein